MSIHLTEEQKRKIVLENAPEKVAAAMTVPIQYAWNMGPPRSSYRGLPSTEQERYDAVLENVRAMLGPLLPDDEEHARAIFDFVPWPVGVPDAWQATKDFGPIPTFESMFGGTCPTCGGTGISGFISGHRCFDC